MAQPESLLSERSSGLGLDLPSAGNTTRKVYIVQLRSPAALEHHVNTRGARASKLTASARPAATFNKDSAEIQSYTQKLTQEQDRAIARVGGSASEKIYSYRYSLNGFAAQLTEVQAAKMRHLPEVLHVWEDEIRPLVTNHSARFLGLFESGTGLRGAPGLDGEGIVIGVIDSGIVPNHPSLDDTRQAGPSACRSNWAESSFIGLWLCRESRNAERDLLFEAPENWNGECQAGDEFTADDCNNKLIGARFFADGAQTSGPIDDGEFFSPRDVDGHGTHTATTAAGNKTNASAFGTFLGEVEGIAPRARIAAYKACWLRPGSTRALCNTSDLARAIDTAVADGVDIINYSVGNTRRDITAPDDLALMAATKAGVFTAASAGNEGPGLATIGSPAGAPWVMTVAASSRDGNHALEAMQVNSPASIAGKYAVREASFTPPLAASDPIEGELVLVDDGDDTLVDGGTGTTMDGCEAIENSDEVSGNIAFIQRGGCAFTTKISNAEDAGATAVVVYSIAGDPIVMTPVDSTEVNIPALMIGQADGNLIVDEIESLRTVEAVLDKSFFLTVDDTGNVMGSFSSRGPAPIQDVLKPDVTAPGINILAGLTPDTPNSNDGEFFGFLTGTSMSAPHVAGVAALLRQAHPEWSPAAIKSALMTTARQDIDNQDGETPANPFDFGAGHIVPNSAVAPGLTYDTTDDEYDAVACGIESPAVDQARCDSLEAAGFSFGAADMNQPSVSVSQLVNERTLTRRVTNVSDTSETYIADIETPPGIAVSVSPDSLSVGPGQTASFDVTLSYLSGTLDLWRFGSLTWSGSEHRVRSPIAVRPASLVAPAEARSFGGSGSATFPVVFGYNGTYTARVHGLNTAFVSPDRFVDQDPDQLFVPVVGPGVDRIIIDVPADQLYVRFALFDSLTDGNDDLDMYIYYCPAVGDCTEIGSSGGPTSEEEFNVFLPGAGAYAVFVHGFATDNVTGGPGAIYRLVAWSVGIDDNKGNMTVVAPGSVAAGTTVDLQVDWTGLIANERYLGAISHTTPQGLVGITVINIQN
jgi:subtilisin family serine protease